MLKGERYYAKDLLEMLRYKKEEMISTDLPWEVRGILQSLEKQGKLKYDRDHGTYSLC